jgi:plastocyanin
MVMTSMKKMLVGVAVSAFLVCASVSLPAGDRSQDERVKIDNFSFVPQVLTIKAGTSVTWTNGDDVPHTVVSTSKKFASSVLDTDGRFSFTFKDPGTYEYYCSVHPHMTGKVVVQ